MKQLILLTTYCLVFAACTTTAPEEKATPDTNLGVLQHQFTLSEESKEDFNKGLLLLHSFEYDDAKEAFQAAIIKDSNEVMAYWGEAMANYRALWGLQDVEAGKAVMAKLDSTKERRLAKAENELEKDFWAYAMGTIRQHNPILQLHRFKALLILWRMHSFDVQSMQTLSFLR